MSSVVFALLLIFSQMLLAAPRNEMFPFVPFQWNKTTITSLEDLYRAMRVVHDVPTARKFKAAMASANLYPEFYLGYALGEFENPVEQDTAELLFEVEHPIMGPLHEVRRLSTPAKYLIGILFGQGFTAAQITEFRQHLLVLPEKAAWPIVPVIAQRNQPTFDWVMEQIRTAKTMCEGMLAVEPNKRPMN